MRVRVLPVRAAAVEGECIGQPLPAAHLRGERARERTPPTRVQFARQGELDLAVEPPVGALMRVCRLPVGVRVVLRPRGHVAVLDMLAFLAVLGIAPLALDVLILGAGGLPTGAGTETDLEVIDRHAVTSVVVLTHAVSRRETGIVRPHCRSGSSLAVHRRCRLWIIDCGDATVYQRWSHKTNCSNYWTGKRPSSRELTAKKKALQEAQRRQRNTLTRQIRRAQARLSSADRKRRTRRLILIGSYIDSVSQADPEAMTRLMKGLDEFLERDQDRALFDLPPRPKDA